MQMKKTALIIAAIAIGIHAFCQSDTIPLNYPFYYPEITMPPFATYPSNSGSSSDTYTCVPTAPNNLYHDLSFPDPGAMFAAIENIADRQLKVIGLAASFVLWDPIQYQSYVVGSNYSNTRIELYHYCGDSLSAFASVPIAMSLDSIDKHMFVTRPQPLNDTFEVWVFEGYFDTPIIINQGDTFLYSAVGQVNGKQQAEELMNAIAEIHGLGSYGITDRHWPIKRVRKMTQDHYWFDDENTLIPLVWLIIRRDEDTCSVPQLYAERLSDNVAFVRWDNNANHAAAEFSFGPAGIAPEDGTITQSPIPQHVFGNLDPDRHYTVYARARCDFARSEWTDWSAPLDIHLASMAGIDATATGPTLTLAPNPARDEARITCSHAMQTVTLFAADGTAVLAVRPDATEATIDLRQLPAGAYTVVVTTAAGNESSRIVKQ